MPRSASNSTSRDEIAYRSYQRTATTITSGENPIPRQDEDGVSRDWTPPRSAAAGRCERSLASFSLKPGRSSSAAAWPSSHPARGPRPRSPLDHRHPVPRHRRDRPGPVVITATFIRYSPPDCPVRWWPPSRSSLCLALPPLPAQQPRKIAGHGSRTASPPPHAITEGHAPDRGRLDPPIRRAAHFCPARSKSANNACV
jgi:hypothetical protein